MAIKLVRTGGNIEVWLGVTVYGRKATDSDSGVLIGQAKTADAALAGAVRRLSRAVEELADRQRLSAVDDYKRREPV